LVVVPQQRAVQVMLRGRKGVVESFDPATANLTIVHGEEDSSTGALDTSGHAARETAPADAVTLVPPAVDDAIRTVQTIHRRATPAVTLVTLLRRTGTCA
jgi:hypothetical protein